MNDEHGRTDPPPGKAQEEATRFALRSWRTQRDRVAAERDNLVRVAIRYGLSKEEIHVITGLGRNTIDRILKRSPVATTSKGEQQQ